ncbi:MAG: surface-adhesin E family protein [Novosphingobium sp.]
MRTFLTGILAVAAFGTTASAAQAEQWRAVAETDSSPFTIMLIDESSVQRQGEIAKAWVMTVMEDASDRDWSHSIIWRQVDCAKNTTQMIHSKFYSHSELLEDNTTPATMQTIREGSMVDGVADVMCGRANYTSGVVSDPVTWSFQKFKTM